MHKSLLLALFAVGLMSGESHAAYPDRAIKVIVPFGTGSATDITARQFGAALSKVAGQNVVVDNRPGAEGLIGVKTLMNDPADGYSVMLATSSITVLDPLLKANPAIDPVRDFIPVCSLMSTPMVGFTTGASPHAGLADFVAAAKANPGKHTYGYASSTTRLAAELFQQQNGIKLRGVPYKTSAQSIQGVAAGEIDFMMNDAVGIAALSKSGKVKPLFVASERRSTVLPEVPSVRELGKPDLKIYAWYALYVNKNTPQDVLTQLIDMVGKAAKDPEYVKSNANAAREDLFLCGSAVTELQVSEMKKFRAVIESSAIEKE